MACPVHPIQVVRGYVGDQQSKPVFDSPTPFDVLGTGYQRPFELATLRLFNMIGVLSKCEWCGGVSGVEVWVVWDRVVASILLSWRRCACST